MYWQIIIQDKSNLSGKAVAELMTELLKTVAYSWVQVYEFEGAADRNVWEDVVKNGSLEASKFFRLIQQVAQVDWGTFCLLKDQNASSCSQTYLEKCLECIRDGEAVVRCVDDQFFYVYTKNNDLSMAIQKKYSCLSAKQVDLVNIEWPE